MPKSAKKKKNPNGRPSKKLSISLVEVEKLAGFGLTIPQMSSFLNISSVTFAAYQKDAKFLNAVKKGKLKADTEVVKSLYFRALGYSHPDVHITNYLGEVIITPIIKHYPPDTAACFIWLKNRCGWRDKTEMEHVIKSYLLEENKERSVDEIKRESERLAATIMSK